MYRSLSTTTHPPHSHLMCVYMNFFFLQVWQRLHCEDALVRGFLQHRSNHLLHAAPFPQHLPQGESCQLSNAVKGGQGEEIKYTLQWNKVVLQHFWIDEGSRGIHLLYSKPSYAICYMSFFQLAAVLTFNAILDASFPHASWYYHPINLRWMCVPRVTI